MTAAADVVLASLNLHGGRSADGARYDVAAACLLLKADIIVLQEAWQPDGQPDPVAEAAQAAEPVEADAAAAAAEDAAEAAALDGDVVSTDAKTAEEVAEAKTETAE